MSNFNQISTAYQSIFNHSDFRGPFVEFCNQVRAQQPSPEMMTANSFQSPLILDVVGGIRTMSSLTRGGGNGHYFRGSGIIVVGDNEGLQAVSYQADGVRPDLDQDQIGDPVAEHYGPYQHVALEKVGKAALAIRLMVEDSVQPDRMYFAINDLLQENGLQAAGIPHHLGYAYDAKNRYVVGASGMLPSQDTAEKYRDHEAQRLLFDHGRGWVEWAGDEFAGFHDRVAAESVIASLACGRTIRFVPLMADGENLH